jgi:RNA polymerase sigma-70 factor, ECF subfamily
MSGDARVERIWREERPHLVRVAARMLDAAEAEDVVQEAFVRLGAADLDEVRDVRGWLTVVVRRLCLNRLGSAYARRESVGDVAVGGAAADPGDRVTLDDQVQAALGVVLERLTPGERTAFVLHDVFGVPFADLAVMVGRTPAACRQLASRARRAVRGQGPARPAPEGAPAGPDRSEQAVVARRFAAACRGGDIDALLAVLDPGVVGEARLVGGRLLDRVAGATAAAATAVRLLGPAGTLARVAGAPGAVDLVPVPVGGSFAGGFDGGFGGDDEVGLVATVAGRAHAVMLLEVAGGRVRHIRAFVLPGRPGRPEQLSEAR